MKLKNCLHVNWKYWKYKYDAIVRVTHSYGASDVYTILLGRGSFSNNGANFIDRVFDPFFFRILDLYCVYV